MPSAVEVHPAPAEDLVAAVEQLLPGQGPWLFEPLSGGVSSDIWRIEGPAHTYCVKRALPRLKVAADWHAPISRNAEEVRWLRFAATVAKDQVPTVIAADAERGVAVLSYFEPRLWEPYKTLLMRGGTRPAIGRELGDLLGRLHRASAGDAVLAAQFDNLALFDALRLEPYFMGATVRNPELTGILTDIVQSQRQHRTVLIHGDFSPKNILIHQSRPPVVLDAECANWGDPAFDVAFMLSHLLLKAIHLKTLKLWLYETAMRFKKAYEVHAPRTGSMHVSTGSFRRWCWRDSTANHPWNISPTEPIASGCARPPFARWSIRLPRARSFCWPGMRNTSCEPNQRMPCAQRMGLTRPAHHRSGSRQRKASRSRHRTGGRIARVL
ncbi:MAG: aminoglycoside phosphotransferase family protein [Gammaproteobacteria bacterium]|nr:aminoglycoside phosphotransferase family protein [Gammaproteobacteria bacterium]